MVRKIVAGLGAFDNVYREIFNEPYFGGVTMEKTGYADKRSRFDHAGGNNTLESPQ